MGVLETVLGGAGVGIVPACAWRAAAGSQEKTSSAMSHEK